MKAIRLQAGSRDVRAWRDGEGVPHIVGATWLDALYGLGFMHATDRATQLLFARCVASGRACGRIADSPELLETDRFFRRVGLHRDLDTEVHALGPARRPVDAYCEGLNTGLLTMGRSLPMWATGFQPHPWNPEATILIGKLLSFGGLAVSQMQNERLLMEMIHAGGNDDALRELFAPRLDKVDFDLLRAVHMANQLSDQALELITDLPRLAGSNAWAVAPSRSGGHGALLASDPHLEINRLPAIWYEAVLQWGDGQYVMGATLPGCPLFSVARTRNLAWGVTYLKGDTIDFFVEDCRRGGASGWQYRREKSWRNFSTRMETIERKNNAPHPMLVLENEQGVLEADSDSLVEGLHLSIAWSGQDEARAIRTWLEIIAASSTEQAMDLARECTQPTLCWVFADRSGHIGLQGCGSFPRRGGGQVGLAPIPAWDPANHWQGLLPKDLLPRQLDPPQGFVATANEELNPPGGPMLMTQPLPDYRKRRIVERLRELDTATIEDMQALQYDLLSTQARDLLAVFLPHMPESPAKEALANWDLRYSPESTEATLFLRLYRNVMIELLGHKHVIGYRRMLYLCSRVGYSTMLLTAADRLLLKQKSRWFHGLSKAELIRRAAERLEQETPPPWSKINNFHFADRFFGSRQVGRILGYRTRQYPMPGNHATPFQGHVLQTAKRESTFAPSYHFTTELDLDQAWTNLPGGPSESRFSKYYRNDIARWFAGEYKRLALVDPETGE